jgi:TM2 domain-containing membrane protein YozV
MRNKNTAAILALILGVFGVHRFYLGQTFLGIIYCMFFWTGVPALLGVIDAVLLAVMNDTLFDAKYNREFLKGNVDPWRQREREQEMEYYRRQREGKRKYEIPVPSTPSKKENPTKLTGIAKYKDYDFKGAIEDFQKAIKIDPTDTSLHFNIACAYSITENAEKAYEHLSNAVTLGFVDFDKISTHDSLAYVRIQPQWDDFVENGFKLKPNVMEIPVTSKEENPSSPDLLEQLKRLGELRERGLLNELEFESQKKKILG